MYNDLIELAKEYTTQDNRATAMPYLFQIQETKEVAAYNGCGETYWFCDEGGKVEYDDEESVIIMLWGCKTEKEAKEKYDELDDCEKDDIFEKNGYREFEVTTQQFYKNAFFTAKACKDHIQRNSYHYSQPTDYLNCSWRNPEMDLISNLLIHLSK